MGILIGGTGNYSTWGVLRTPIGNGFPMEDPPGTVKIGSQGGHSFEYTKGFTASWGGLLTYNPFYASEPNDTLPTFGYIDGGFDPEGNPNPSFFILFAPASPYPAPLIESDLDALDGATVTFSNGSFTLNAAAWGGGPGQSVAPDLGVLLDVSICAAF